MKVKPITVKHGNVAVKIYSQTRPYGDSTRTTYLLADNSGGKRRLRGFSDLAEARTEAERIARQTARGDVIALRMTDIEAASYGRAMGLLRPCGAPLEMAVSTYTNAVAKMKRDGILEAVEFYLTHHRQTTSKSVAEVVAELIVVKKSRDASERYIGDLESRLTRFSKSFTGEISRITTAEIQGWLDGLKLSTQSYVNFRRVVHLLFAHAVARGYAVNNPVADVESIKVRNAEIEIFTPSEMAAMLADSDKDFATVLAIGAFSGVRTAEILRLCWEDIDLPGRMIKIGKGKAKTASRRIIPIHDNLAAWLADGGSEKVWKKSSSALVNTQRSTAIRAGLQWRHNGMRHSYASYRCAQIGDAGRVAAECGNSAAVIHAHYRELVTLADAAAWFSILPAPIGAT